VHAIHVVLNASTMRNLKVAVVASVPKLASVTGDVIHYVEEICFNKATN
jgi:hypothetical protein